MTKTTEIRCTRETCPSRHKPGVERFCYNLYFHPGARFDGEIGGKRAQLVRRANGGSCARPPTKVEVYREYADTPGLFEFVGYFEDLQSTHPHIAATVAPYISQMA